MFNNYMLEDILANLSVISFAIASVVCFYIIYKDNSRIDYCNELEMEVERLRDFVERYQMICEDLKLENISLHQSRKNS